MKILLGIVVAIVSLKWWPELPPLSALLPVGVILFLLRKCLPAFAMGLTVGGLIAYSAAALFLFKTNSALTVAHDTTIEGKVGSLFTTQNLQTNVIFDVDTVDGRKLNVFERFRARIYWRWDEPPKQGERWKLNVRLREPYGRVNEAGFDAEVYFLSKHIHAKGSLREAERTRDTQSTRQRLLNKVIVETENLPSARFLIALTFGERNMLTNEDWSRLRNTGLGHLLAISGLHIGLAFLFGYAVTKIIVPLLFRSDQCLWLPLIAGMLAAIAYAWLAGFSLTAQRALFALFVASGIRMFGARFNVFEALLIVLAVVLIFDPLSVFSASFWLSFGAVTILCVSVSFSTKSDKIGQPKRLEVKGFIFQLLRIQAYLMVGMLPITWLWFGGVSVPAFALNIIAVPLVSFVTVPAILLAILSSALHMDFGFWQLADWSLLPVMTMLEMFDIGWLSPSDMSMVLPVLIWGLALVLLITPLKSVKVLKASLLVAIAVNLLKPVDKSAWRASVLDVGHGLSVLIEKDGKAVVYDTGAAWKNGNMAQLVLKPVLDKRGLILSGMIISHGDNDHSGGEVWIVDRYSLDWVRSSENKAAYLACVKGERWTWQGLEFEVLHPNRLVERARNEDSCVVRVSDGLHSVLLTGDLPEKGEMELLQDDAKVSSTVLLVPHHGSKSSSSSDFLTAVNPDVAIASAGRYTPWNLPNKAVVERYRELGIAWYDTIESGQISVHFSDRGWRLSSQRQHQEPFWYRKMFGAPTRKE
ncbi:DNA internalization-related competence protein ComEC/Rec2 [Enterovibrio coralii]|uniref:MBL fold metallo-hydrolase n=1 Tax=Enterovibrio coralii TaxID=294935 RepID=A0A135I929_9GAMM|nr:DNA internalization-related competence protein ComEC/Rec2 [Enterovibrio coralii]KXF81959.1 MBL fold metallo-hydrolase [Enterovibrio coralii]